MSIYNYEIFDTYGALDSNAFDDAQDNGGPEILGESYSSHLLRTMAMDHNRLLTKPELLFNLAWPVETHLTNADNQIAETFGGVTVADWRLVHPAILVFKKHGHAFLNFRMSIRLAIRNNTSTDATVYVQVCTGATQFDSAASDNADNVVSVRLNQDDGFGDIDISDIPMLPGSMDEVSVFMSGDISSVAPTTATYGSPASGTLDQTGDFIERDAIFDADATWNITNSSNRTLATEGFVLVFTDLNGNEMVSPRAITGIQNFNLAATGRRMFFSPELSDSEMVLVQATQTYKILSVPNFWIANLMGYSVARSE